VLSQRRHSVMIREKEGFLGHAQIAKGKFMLTAVTVGRKGRDEWEKEEVDQSFSLCCRGETSCFIPVGGRRPRRGAPRSRSAAERYF